MSNSLIIVDGLNYLFRAYFGIPDSIRTRNGIAVNAVYGFFSFLRKVVDAIEAKYVIVVFDSETAAFQKQMKNSDYKANRTYGDLRIFAQLRVIKSILDDMGIGHLEEEGIEADDLIGTYCHRFQEQIAVAYISSNDFDFMQLVSNRVHVVRTFRKEQQIFDELDVEKRFGVTPKAYPDYLALLGDRSDNIKGIKGIGKETAKKLIVEYGSVERLVENVHLLPERIQNILVPNLERILANKKLMTIDKNISECKFDLDHFLFDPQKLMVKTSNYIDRLGV